MADEFNTDVAPGSSTGDVGSSAPAADAPVGTEGQGTVDAPQSSFLPQGYQVPQEQQQPAPQAQAQPDRFTIPETDDDLVGQPGEAGIRSLREELRKRDSEMAAFRERTPDYEVLQQAAHQYGGVANVQEGMALVADLFSPVIGADGQPERDGNGVPLTDPTGFVQKLGEMSPATLWKIGDAILGMTNPVTGEPAQEIIFREMFGLDPNMLGLYQSIRSPEDAAARNLLDNQLDADELEGIPERFHDAFKSLPENQRIRLAGLSDAERDLFLDQQVAILDSQRFQEEMRQQRAQYEERQRQAAEQQIQTNGDRLAESVRTNHAQQVLSEIGKIQYSADPSTNNLIRDMIGAATLFRCDTDPQTLPLLQRADQLYHQSERLNAKGEKIAAGQVKMQADALALQISNKARLWAQTLMQAIGGLNGQLVNNQQTQPGRPVISSTRAQEQQGQQQNALGGLKPFSPERLRQLEGSLFNNGR